jgi:EmrB/QacA subfamily drug resistance transporter
VLLATVLGSGIAFLDATVVNVALPTIGEDLDAGIAGLQWVVNAYTLTLAGLLLLGGSLGDHYGRRRVFVIGVVWFAAASLLCGLAPTIETLIAARALQGIGGALLTPGSLAIIEASFRQEDRAPAIGAWSGLGGVTAALGPFLGGWLVEAATWRLIFLINLPLAAVVVWVAGRHVPESRDPGAVPGLDYTGAALAAFGLAGVVYALTDGPTAGWTSTPILLAGLAGVAALVAFVVWERRSRHPMLPLDIFASRQFTAANLVTLVVYGALGGALFLMPIQLQRVVGFSPLASGVALIPITVVMLLLSARAGRLSSRIGPRLPMTLGPLLVAGGFLLFIGIDAGSSYLTDILPGALLFAFGLTLTVAPLTATVLAAAPAEHAGIASAVNNDVARTAGLLAVAVLPVAAGISGADALEPAVFSEGFHMACAIAAVLCVAGGLISWVFIRRPEAAPAAAEAAGAAEVVASAGPGRLAPTAAYAPAGDGHHMSCPLSAPPLRHPPRRAAAPGS